MTKRGLWIGAALACSLGVSGAIASSAQEREEKREERREERRVEERDRAEDEGRDRDRGRRESRAPMARRAKEVLGSKVSLRGDIAIGTVDDIVFSDDGYIDYLVVLNEGKRVIVPWEAASFNFEKRAATVQITQERFRDIPTYTEERLPDVYEPAFRRRIYTSWGIEATPERRIIRRPGLLRRP